MIQHVTQHMTQQVNSHHCMFVRIIIIACPHHLMSLVLVAQYKSHLVFGSLVWSSLFPSRGLEQDWDWSTKFGNPQKTGLNRCRLVFCGFLQSVMTSINQTGQHQSVSQSVHSCHQVRQGWAFKSARQSVWYCLGRFERANDRSSKEHLLKTS